MRWDVDDGKITAIFDENNAYTQPYVMSETNDAHFEVMIDDGDIRTRISIQRTEYGFCARSSISTKDYPEWNDTLFVECFKADET